MSGYPRVVVDLLDDAADGTYQREIGDQGYI